MASPNEIQAARDALAKGDVVAAYDHLVAHNSNVFRTDTCPGCSQNVTALCKSGHEAAECPSCGASWGKRASGPIGALVKSDRKGTDTNEMISKGRPEVEQALWDLWRTTGGEGVDAWAINAYSATGFIQKSLLEKIGITVPTQPEPLKKSEPLERTYSGLSKSEVLNLMFELFQKGEEHQHVNRHSITKFDQFGVLDPDALRIILRKAGKDPDQMIKSPAPKLEDQEGIDPELADPGKEPKEEPKARFGSQAIDAKPKPGLGDARLKQLVSDNPANGDGQAIGKPKGKDPIKKAAIDLSQPAPAPNTKLGHHFLFSAENPGHPDKVAVKAGHEQVLHGLKRMGMAAREVRGKYAGKPERSIMVHDPKPHDIHTLHNLARSLGQESALHSDGDKHRLYYYHGENAGKYHEGQGTEWMSHEPEDAYTCMTDPDSGAHSYFRHNLDFSKLHSHVDDGSKAAGESKEPVQEEPKLSVVKSEKVENVVLAGITAAGLALGGYGVKTMHGAVKELDALRSPPAKTATATPGKKDDKIVRKSEDVLRKACPGCGASKDPESHIGDLGSRKHYRCRDCGTGYSHESKRKPKKSKDPKPSEADEVSKALKSLAPSPAAPAKTSTTLMKQPKPVVAKGIAGPKPAVAKPPKPAASAKAITTAVAPKGTVQKTIKPPSFPGNDAIEQKQSIEGSNAHSLTAPKEQKPKFIHPGIDPKTGKKKLFKKSDALKLVQDKLETLGKSAVPTDRMVTRRWAELYTRILLEKSDEIWLEEF